MTLPMHDPQNPWRRTSGRSSTGCGLSLIQGVDLLRKVGPGRYAYEMAATPLFEARAAEAYVIAWRPHQGDPDTPATETALARRRAQAVADFLSGSMLCLRGVA
jgi:hypothetical protein